MNIRAASARAGSDARFCRLRAYRPTQPVNDLGAVIRILQIPTVAMSCFWVSRGSIGAIVDRVVRPDEHHARRRIVVPTRPRVTCSLYASAVCTLWSTAAKLDLHGNTP